ncbi:hypothetical protein HDU92_001653 [Lobulomyces angularis]|nr:hypothetical protein HDU92_001653 [Lobulomyces angularis]
MRVFFKSLQQFKNPTLNAFEKSKVIQYKPHKSENQERYLFKKRFFKPNETYEPKDLNDENLRPFIEHLEKQKKPDYFMKTGIDPIKEYKNVGLLSLFVSELGMIKPSKDTGLNRINQRKLAKSVKRAQSFGLMPYTYKWRKSENKFVYKLKKAL